MEVLALKASVAKATAASLPGSSVLVVDPAEDTREVLEAIFERRGVRVWGARRADEGLRLARKHRPKVIVWDLDAKAQDPAAVADGFEQAAREQHGELLVIGNRRAGSADGNYVAKPFQFAPLVRQIEELLARTSRPLARAA
jgi:CheY-like chemotaxis protein